MLMAMITHLVAVHNGDTIKNLLVSLLVVFLLYFLESHQRTV